MGNQIILSLCIPTNGAVQWVKSVLDSIYCQNYDENKYEVLVTDNGKGSNLGEYIKNYGHTNLRYIRTKDEGFLNLVTSLKEGHGIFCKMINHRSVLLPNSIADMVDVINRYKDSQPIIYCANSLAKCNRTVECDDLNTFLYHISYWSSWSAGIGFWHKDLPKIEQIVPNKMFPNTSLLFEVRDNSKYVIWNKRYMHIQDDPEKGGYNLFYTFAVVFLDLINDLRVRERISKETFLKIKKELLFFLTQNYTNEIIVPNRHNFIIKDIKKDISIYYGTYYYMKMIILAFLLAPYHYVKKIKRK